MQSGSAVARACYFDTEAGFGTFAMLPLVAGARNESPDAIVGLRYSSPEASVGVITQPLTQQLRQIWGVRRPHSDGTAYLIPKYIFEAVIWTACNPTRLLRQARGQRQSRCAS